MFALRIIFGIVVGFSLNVSRWMLIPYQNFLQYWRKILVWTPVAIVASIAVAVLLVGIVWLGLFFQVLWVSFYLLDAKTPSLKKPLKNPATIAVGLVASLCWVAYLFLLTHLYQNSLLANKLLGTCPALGALLLGLFSSVLTLIFCYFGYGFVYLGRDLRSALQKIWQAEIQRQYPSAHARLAQKRTGPFKQHRKF